MMGIWHYLRRFVEAPADEKPAEPLRVQSWHEGNCRYFEWSTHETSWEGSERLIERFLASAVESATAAGRGRFSWLVLTYEPKQGALTLVPATDPNSSADDWPVHWTLGSSFLKGEAETALAASTPKIQEHALRIWKVVSRSLTKGEASKCLAKARGRQTWRVTGFDYFEGQERGPPRLKEVGNDGAGEPG